jgi:MoaD family protein
VRVHVRLFASYREAAGRGQFEMEFPNGATPRVRDVLSRVLAEHPLLRSQREIVAARNREYVDLDAPLAEGDEVALIPPVSGGAITRTDVDVLVTAEPLSADAALTRVRGQDAGGVCLFIGTVRNRSRGKRVTLLEYEAYPEMAEAKIAEIAREAAQRWGPLRIAIHHRVGRLAIGDDAVIIAVAAPHRGESFAACRFAIDRLKEIVPIWKKEHTDDGAVWIEDHA